MVSVQDAVRSAAEFASTVFKEKLAATAWIHEVRLEEIEQGEAHGAPVWLITLSVPKGVEVLGGPGRFPHPDERHYKVFAVDKETGEVRSMKIREFAGVHD